jgi:tRNA threonylcarbamoyladenosine biosynthesis protein TsaE
MKKEEKIFDYQDIPKIVETLYCLMKQCKVFAFEGPLGAGKTTIIRALLEKCGVHEAITSPTFTYVNVYENEMGHLFYHFDLYRLNSLEEFIQAGFDELLYLEDSWVFIEWPEIVMPLLKKQVCSVKIDYLEDEKRLITYKINDF